MTTQNTHFTLNTGAQIPAVGFGTWQDADAQEAAVAEALNAGYRHIDTARIYGTEKAVGSAIKKSGIPREKLFITTKLWNNSHHSSDVMPALDASLKDLDTPYIDLYLMHWPSPFARSEKLMPKDENGKIQPGTDDFVDTWKAMEATLQTGKTKAIGISNFSRAEIERLLAATTVIPAAHQLELHPWLQQRDFVAWHKSKGIHVTQYSPFGNQNAIYSAGQNMGKLIDDPVLASVGEKYGKNGAQTALAWGIAHGHSVLPKSKTPARIWENLEGDFALEAADLKTLDGLDKKLRFSDPSSSFGWDFYTDLEGKK